MAIRAYGQVAVVFGLSAALACSEDTTRLGPGDTAGTGGSTAGAGGSLPGGGGSAGEPVGVGGMDSGVGVGGMDSGIGDAGAARFRAVLEGTLVSLQTLDDVWMRRCEDGVEVVQRMGDTWVPLRDERPAIFNRHHAAHYLDGAYHSDCRLSLGCDVGGYCGPFSDIDWPDNPQDDWETWNMSAREFVQVGESEALTCEALDAGAGYDGGSDAGVRLVPALESRAATGALGVRIRYYLDGACSTPALTAVVEVE